MQGRLETHVIQNGSEGVCHIRTVQELLGPGGLQLRFRLPLRRNVRSKDRMIKERHILLILIMVFSWTGSSIGASFSCDPSPCQPGEPCSASAQSKNFSLVEELICDDPSASLLDEKVAGLVWLARELSSDRSKALSKQKKWLKEKRDVCKATECVIAAYEARYVELKQQVSKQLKLLPKESSWSFTTPPVRSPDSYCARFADRELTSDSIGIYLTHDGKTISGKGDVVIDCGLRIQEINPIGGYLEDGIGWLEFDGGFSQLKPIIWRALIAFDGKKLYWKVVHKTEVESHIDLELLLVPSNNAQSNVKLKELKESSPQESN
jgi:hypothetical protein